MARKPWDELIKQQLKQEVVGTQMPGQKMGGLIAATSDSTTTF